MADDRALHARYSRALAGKALPSEFVDLDAFVASGLFGEYRELSLVPAAGFARQVTRQPAPGIDTLRPPGWY